MLTIMLFFDITNPNGIYAFVHAFQTPADTRSSLEEVIPLALTVPVSDYCEPKFVKYV